MRKGWKGREKMKLFDCRKIQRKIGKYYKVFEIVESSKIKNRLNEIYKDLLCPTPNFHHPIIFPHLTLKTR